MLSKGNNYIEPNATRLRAVDNGYFYAGNEKTDPTVTANQVPVYYVDESGESLIQEQPIKLNKSGVPVLKNGQAFDPVIGATIYSFSLFDKKGNPVEYNDSASGFVTEKTIDRMMGYTNKGNYQPYSVTLENEGDYVLDDNGERWFAINTPYKTNPTLYPHPSSDKNLTQSLEVSKSISCSSVYDAVERINSGAKFIIASLTDVEIVNTPLVIKDVDGWSLRIVGTLNQQKHGYNALIIDNCKQWHIAKSGLIQGHGLFPSKDIGSTNGGGEKRLSLDTTGRFGQNTGDDDQGMGSFGGGFLGCVGSAVTIRNGCEDFYCGINTTGFNGYGVITGDLSHSLSDTTEPLNKNGLIDGSHDGNYIAGIGLLACDNVNVSDEASSSNNGHPDALESDDEINPGYGVTSILVSDSGNYARNCTVGNCNLVGNKRKGFDVHSGLNIRCKSPYIEGSFIHGISYGGGSGVRNGGGWESPKIVNCGTATGGLTDTKTGIAVANFWEKLTPSGKPEIKNSGRDFSVYWQSRNSSFGQGFIIDSEGSSWVGNRPMYIQGDADNILDNLSMCNVMLIGKWTNPVLIKYAKGLLDNWIATEATITNSPKGQIEFEGCDIRVGSGNTWAKPLFNIGNSGTMDFAKSELTVKYNGTTTVDEVVKVNSGSEFIDSILNGGSGIFVQAISSSDDPSVVPPFEHTALVSDSSLASATFENVNYGRVRVVSSTAGGKQQIIVSPRASDGSFISMNSSEISQLILSVQINWHFQK